MIIEQNEKMATGIQIVNNQGQITNQEQFNEALFSLMEERFKGGMEIQATSFKGLMSTIRGVFSTTIATMAGISETGEVKIGGFFDKVKKKMQEIIDKLAEWRESGQLEEWADRAQQALSKFFEAAEKVFKFLVSVGQFIVKHWGVILPILAGVLAGFLAFRTAIVVVNALTLATRLLNGALAMNPIGLVVIAIGALVAAGVSLYRNWDKVRETGIRVWSALKLYILNAVDGMLVAIEKLAGWIPGVGDKVKEARAGISEKISYEQALGRARSGAGDYDDALTRYVKNQEAAAEATERTGGAVYDLGESAAASGGKAAKSAKDTRAEWEKTADLLRLQLKGLQTEHETAALATEDQADSAQTLVGKIQQLSKELELQKQIVAEVRQGYNQMVESKTATAEETEKLRGELLEEQKAQAELEKKIRSTTQALRDQKETLGGLIDEAERLKVKLQDDLAAALEEYQKKSAEVNRKLVEDERRLQEEFERTVQDRARSLRDFVGLFDAVTGRDVAGSDLLANLRGQVAAFEDWAKNIEALVARGVDEGLIQELREMGAKAGPEIAALNTLTDEELQEYVTLWRQKNEQARREAVDQLQLQRQEMQQKLIEIRQAAQEQLEIYRAEWEKKNAEIRKNAEEVMKQIEARFESISKAGTVYGIALMDNFIQAIRSRMDALQEEIDHVRDTTGGIDPAVRRSPSLIDRVQSGLREIVDAYRAAVAEMGNIDFRGSMSALTPAALGPAIVRSQVVTHERVALLEDSAVKRLVEALQAAGAGRPSIVVNVYDNVFQDGRDAGNKIYDSLRRLGG